MEEKIKVLEEFLGISEEEISEGYTDNVFETSDGEEYLVVTDEEADDEFYDYEAESASQENSIIFYENTYMQNSGVDYTNKEVFEIIAILDGTVIEVSDNEILGKTIKIRHNNDLISTYQSLSEVSVKENENVIRGQIIGKSGTCALHNNDSNLHFELYNQGKTVNPEEYYNKTLD